MKTFATKVLPRRRDDVAPDGSDVRVLLALSGGGLAQFQLAAMAVSRAVRHRTVDEIWYVVSGAGEMWRRCDGNEDVVSLHPDLCLTLPVGTEFQFRSLSAEPLTVIGVTMPPWPGADEAVVVSGPWEPTVTGD